MRPVLSAAVVIALACSASSCAGRTPSDVVRVTGSDTMVNLVQAWAERYALVAPEVSVRVAGGGSGVGIAGLIDGTVDVAAASRDMRESERERTIARTGAPPRELTVALDALAVYVHPTNPIESISLEELADIYRDRGPTVAWWQLGVAKQFCSSGRIVRVGRQNNSGTFAYFRHAVLGDGREYKLGSIDQSGSKDVVALVSRTPCAIGYSGIAFATAEVKTLALSGRTGGRPVRPGTATVVDRTYPLARPLLLYTAAAPATAVTAFMEWVRGEAGQRIAADLGFVPARTLPDAATEGP